MPVRLRIFVCLALTISCVVVIARLPIQESKAAKPTNQSLGIEAKMQPTAEAVADDRSIESSEIGTAPRQCPPLLNANPGGTRLSQYGDQAPRAISTENSRLVARSTGNQIRLVTYNASYRDDDSEIEAEAEKTNRWPKPTELVAQIKALLQIPQAEPWASATLELLQTATQTPIDSPESAQILNELEFQQQQVRRLANDVWNTKSVDAPRDASEVCADWLSPGSTIGRLEIGSREFDQLFPDGRHIRYA